MKKIILIIISVVVLSACSNVESNGGIDYKTRAMSGLEQEICSSLERVTGDKFYFVSKISENKAYLTNIRYRGILYSGRLEAMKWPKGLEIGLESYGVGGAQLYYIKSSYEELLKSIKLDVMVERKAREIFGKKCNLSNDWMMTDEKYEYITDRIGVEGLSNEKKNRANTTIVNVFCDDLEKLDGKEYRLKTYNLAKYIYNYMNYGTLLQIYIRDNKYFENYKLVYYSIYPPFRNRVDIVTILKKIKNKEPISEEEKVKLVEVFRKVDVDVKSVDYKRYTIEFYKEDTKSIELSNVYFEDEIKNGVRRFIRLEGLEK